MYCSNFELTTAIPIYYAKKLPKRGYGKKVSWLFICAA